MEPVHEQKDANRFMEGGAFYPTGHVIAAFESAEDAKKAQAELVRDHCPEDHVVYVDAESMAREAEENLQHVSFLSAGASLPAREKQLELARQDCHFLMIFAPDAEDERRVMELLGGHTVRYAVKYHRLTIENLVKDIHSTASEQKEAARTP